MKPVLNFPQSNLFNKKDRPKIKVKAIIFDFLLPFRIAIEKIKKAKIIKKMPLDPTDGSIKNGIEIPIMKLPTALDK